MGNAVRVHLITSAGLMSHSRQFSFTTKHTMGKIEWNVIVFDRPGTDRTEVRPKHVAAIPESVNSGIVTSVGALFKDESKTSFAGTALQLMAESKEEILDFLKRDIYYTSGIWDLDSVIVHPVGVAARLGKTMPGVTKI